MIVFKTVRYKNFLSTGNTFTEIDLRKDKSTLVQMPTGSGKTIAFGIPLIANSKRGEPKHPGSLILAPTRELAEQIFSELRTFAGKTKIGVVYGGVGYGNQIKSLKQGIDILVACPGRLEDLIEQCFVNL